MNVRDASAGDPLGNGPSRSRPSTSGALVIRRAGKPGASSAGIQVGDVITSVADKSVADSNALHLALAVFHPGDTVKIGWVDVSGTHHDAQVKLVAGPPA